MLIANSVKYKLYNLPKSTEQKRLSHSLADMYFGYHIQRLIQHFDIITSQVPYWLSACICRVSQVHRRRGEQKYEVCKIGTKSTHFEKHHIFWLWRHFYVLISNESRTLKIDYAFIIHFKHWWIWSSYW